MTAIEALPTAQQIRTIVQEVLPDEHFIFVNLLPPGVPNHILAPVRVGGGLTDMLSCFLLFENRPRPVQLRFPMAVCRLGTKDAVFDAIRLDAQSLSRRLSGEEE